MMKMIKLSQMMMVSLVTLKKLLLTKLVLTSKILTMLILILKKTEDNNVEISKSSYSLNLEENGQAFITCYIKTLGETLL